MTLLEAAPEYALLEQSTALLHFTGELILRNWSHYENDSLLVRIDSDGWRGQLCTIRPVLLYTEFRL